VCLPAQSPRERHSTDEQRSANDVIPVNTNVRALPKAFPPPVDAVVMLDSQDWCAGRRSKRLLGRQIDRCGKEMCRVIFRTAGETSPLESETSVSDVELGPKRDQARSARGLAPDRYGIYGGFICIGGVLTMAFYGKANLNRA